MIFQKMSTRMHHNYLLQNHCMHNKSNLIKRMAGYYTSRILTQRKGDTLIIKGPFPFLKPCGILGAFSSKLSFFRGEWEDKTRIANIKR